MLDFRNRVCVIKGGNGTQSGVVCLLIQWSVLYLSRNKLSQCANWENFIPLQYTKLTYKATGNPSVHQEMPKLFAKIKWSENNEAASKSTQIIGSNVNSAKFWLIKNND